MQKLYFPATESSPEICFSPGESNFFIKGISCPEDVRSIYYPVIEWIQKFGESLGEENAGRFTESSPLIFRVDLEYYNSATDKFLYDIFLELKRLEAAGNCVNVEWIYDADDTDLREAGSDLASLAGMNFTYVSKNG